MQFQPLPFSMVKVFYTTAIGVAHLANCISAALHFFCSSLLPVRSSKRGGEVS